MRCLRRVLCVRTYATMAEVENDYMNDRLGAPDLKQNLIRIINECVYSSHLLSLSLFLSLIIVLLTCARVQVA